MTITLICPCALSSWPFCPQSSFGPEPDNYASYLRGDPYGAAQPSAPLNRRNAAGAASRSVEPATLAPAGLPAPPGKGESVKSLLYYNKVSASEPASSTNPYGTGAQGLGPSGGQTWGQQPAGRPVEHAAPAGYGPSGAYGVSGAPQPSAAADSYGGRAQGTPGAPATARKLAWDEPPAATAGPSAPVPSWQSYAPPPQQGQQAHTGSRAIFPMQDASRGSPMGGGGALTAYGSLELPLHAYLPPPGPSMPPQVGGAAKTSQAAKHGG